MKLDKDQATAHAALNGWNLSAYTADYTGDPGWAFVNVERREWVRTTNGRVLTRNSPIPVPHPQEISPETVPSAIFWRLFDRLLLVGLLPVIPGHRKAISDFDDETI